MNSQGQQMNGLTVSTHFSKVKSIKNWGAWPQASVSICNVVFLFIGWWVQGWYSYGFYAFLNARNISKFNKKESEWGQSEEHYDLHVRGGRIITKPICPTKSGFGSWRHQGQWKARRRHGDNPGGVGSLSPELLDPSIRAAWGDPLSPLTTTMGDGHFILRRNWVTSAQNSGTSRHEGPAESKRITERAVYWAVGPATTPLFCSQLSRRQM